MLLNLLKAVKIIKKILTVKFQIIMMIFSLPGIGDYTAKAILGIAYNQPVMPLDANIERILARIYGFQLPLIKIKIRIKRKIKFIYF